MQPTSTRSLVARFTVVATVVMLMTALFVTAAFAAPKNDACATVKDGTIVDRVGNPISIGFDEFGYNYQAHLFNGTYDGYDRVITGDGADVALSMKWNDAWLANTDCDGDHKLDRHYGHDSYIGSGAWLTNHMSGEYELDGETHTWTYFVKIVAVPSDAHEVDGIWYTADGVVIGPVIWGSFAIIQEVGTDGGGPRGIQVLSEFSAGFGVYSTN